MSLARLTASREHAVRGGLGKPEKLDLFLFLKDVESELTLSPRDRGAL